MNIVPVTVLTENMEFFCTKVTGVWSPEITPNAIMASVSISDALPP